MTRLVLAFNSYPHKGVLPTRLKNVNELYNIQEITFQVYIIFINFNLLGNTLLWILIAVKIRN